MRYALARTRLRILIVTALAMIPCVATASASGVFFTEIGSEAGVAVVHDPRGFSDGGQEIPNFYGPGVAWADVNNDRWLDLIIGNGESGNFIFLNDGDGTFTDVSRSFGTQTSRVANGIALADIDNDGDLDMAVGNFYAEPQFYIGNGAHFAERGEIYGVNPLFYDAVNPPPFPVTPESMGVSFGDFNKDGYVDLYVANYMLQPDMLMQSLGGGYFQRTSKVEVTDQGYGFTGIFWDFDNDSDLDIYVVNDFGTNFLFENQGRASGWEFVDMAAIYKIAGGGTLEPKSMGMGVAIADYDNDQDLDVYITNYFLNSLYENLGPQVNDLWRFRERAKEAGVEYDYNCWGVDFCDLDLDGDLDLIQASGNIPSKQIPQPIDLPNKVWLNDGAPNWTFTDVSEAADFNDRMLGRGLATADFDRDGDLDVVVTNNTWFDPAPDAPGAVVHEGHVLLYRNDQTNGYHWVNLKLQGAGQHGGSSGCNRAAIGARVYLTAGGSTQMREVQAGSSYLSQNSLEVEFGIGASSTIDQVLVRWMCGAEESYTGVEPDRFYRLVEGDATAIPMPVALLSFEARPALEGIRLEWLTAPGIAALETRIYRAPADSPDDLRRILLPIEQDERTGWAIDREVVAKASYAYQLVLVGEDGIGTVSATIFATAGGTSSPMRATVGQNYPNPFNPHTTIAFSLPRPMQIRLVIYDDRGRLVRTLRSGMERAGSNTADWDGTDESGRPVASGNYSYALITKNGTSSRRLVLVR
jgi:hypothetical protein